MPNPHRAPNARRIVCMRRIAAETEVPMKWETSPAAALAIAYGRTLVTIVMGSGWPP
jgi:hypothetical protein